MSAADPWSQPTENMPKVYSPRPGAASQSGVRLAIVVTVAVLAVLALSGAGLAYYSSTYDGRIYPGVRVLGTSVSGKTPDEARTILAQRANAYLQAPITLRHGDREWKATPEQLGLRLDVEPLVQKAYQRGRTGSFIAKWRERIPVLSPEVAINSQYILDRGRIQAYVAGLSKEIERAPVNSTLTISPDGRFIASPDVSGQRLDTVAAEDQVYKLVSRLATDEVVLPVTTVPASQTRAGWHNAEKLQAAVSRPVKLQLRDRTWTLGPQQLASAVVVAGGSGEVAGSFDAARLKVLLKPVAADVRREPRDAALKLEGTQAVLTPEKVGEQLNVDQSARAITAAVAAGKPAALVTKPVPAQLTADKLQPGKQRLDALLASPIVLSFQSQSWAVDPPTLAQWVKVDVDVKQQTVSVKLDQDPIRAYLQQLSGQIAQLPADGALTWNNGLVVTKPSVEGHELSVKQALSEFLRVAFTPTRTVRLPVTITKPRVPTDDLPALGINTVIATGTSEFTGSPPERIHNIQTAAGYLNNTIVAPGEVFSFNNAIGEISLARGYQEGLTIVADQTVPGIGGGVCQVSTTMFRAAFWAGVPILERHQHSYLVPYYQLDGSPVGFDAAVYQPWADLKWKNNTGKFVLVQTSWTDKQLTVSLYGTDSGITVQMGEPQISNVVKPPPDKTVLDKTLPPGTKEQTEWAHDGMDVVLTRTVQKDGQVVLQDKFTSKYQPWPNVFKVGPPKPKPPSTPTPSTTPTPTPTPSPTPTPTPTP